MTAQPALFAQIHAPADTAETTKPYTWAKPWGWRTSKLARCRRCRTSVLRGHNDDWCAFLIDADPVPLTPLGELRALMSGLTTLTATRNGDRLLLTRRDRWAIASRPAGAHRPGNRWDVVPTHQCGTTWPADAVTESAIAPPSTTTAERCPF